MKPTQPTPETKSNNYSRYLPYAAAGITASAAFYFLYRWFRTAAPFVASEIERKLPVAKNLKTIPDAAGNYDIDGVSFDSDGVVVGSDKNRNAPINPS